MVTERLLRSVEDTEEYAQSLRSRLQPGQIFLLSGPLGAGKTTLVRGVLRSLGWGEAVRSPTFNLLTEYPTNPPLLHADLYRVQSAEGLGLEEYWDSHVCFIEWPDRLHDLLNGYTSVNRIELSMVENGRLLREVPSTG